MTERIVTAEELGDILAVSPRTIVLWASKGIIPELRPTRRVRRFDVGEVMESLRNRPVAGGQPQRRGKP